MGDWWDRIVIEGEPEKRGRPKKWKDDGERKRKSRQELTEDRGNRIATLDFETNPFDNSKPDEKIWPFVVCLYTEQYGAKFAWNDDPTGIIDDTVALLEELPGDWLIYAHNGGRFDYRFLMSRMTGKINFINGAVLQAKIGRHTLRDSLRILPIPLNAYKKDTFNYKWLTPKLRHKHEKQIYEYLEADCVYLYQLVNAFNSRFGPKLTVGQASFAEIKATYPNIQHLGENIDKSFRQYYFGGRVECVAGAGRFVGNYKLYDVNSMYPYVMAHMRHPIGAGFDRSTKRPKIGPNTCFVELKCKQHGAFPTIDPFDGKLSFNVEYGTFHVSIHEFNAAQELGLLSNIRILSVIDCKDQTDFHDFVYKFYEERHRWKAVMNELKEKGLEHTDEYLEAKRQDLLVKFILNSCYGKFAQNPRNFTDCFIRAWQHGDYSSPPEGFSGMPKWQDFKYNYEVWEKPSRIFKYNNVATAASITGAARSVLLRGLYNAKDPIYCDTDSIICKHLDGVPIHPTELGAWDIEEHFSEVMIAGRKTYACKRADDSVKVRSKGVRGVTWDEMAIVVGGGEVLKHLDAPTINWTGKQVYLNRLIKSTTAVKSNGASDIFGRNLSDNPVF